MVNMPRHVAATRTVPDTKPTKDDNGSVPGRRVAKLQDRTYELLRRIMDLEAEQMMKATGGGACEGCVEEFRKRIVMTDIIHRAVLMFARAKGIKP